jgi:TonB family protein
MFDLKSKRRSLASRNQKRALTTSIIIHLILLFLFLFHAFKQQRKITIIPIAKKVKERKKIVALFPKKSDFGTKIFFDQETLLPTKPTEQIDPQKKQEAIKQEVIKQVQKKIKKRKAVPKRALKKQKKEEQIQTKIIKEIDVKKVATENIVKKQEKSIQQPEKKSLVSLTKCFLDHQKGNSCMWRKGEERLPTFEEMKYICYEKQIQDHLVASWKSLYRHSEVPPARGETRFTFLINENGKAEDVVVITSSGNRNFDLMVVESVRNAAFPPIPKHFGVKKYRPQGGRIVIR